MKTFLLLIPLIITSVSYSQSDEEKMAQLDRDIVLSSIRLVCNSLNEESESTFNAYEKSNAIYCDVDLYSNLLYKQTFAKEIDSKFSATAKEIIYNRIVTQINKATVFNTIKEAKIPYYIMYFKIRFNTVDGTVLKYKYYISMSDMQRISAYLNKDDFNNYLMRDYTE